MVAPSPATDPGSPKDDRDRSLLPLLFVLTVVTGLVDAVSYLKLGHVFVANMTGNVVFLGFAVAGAQDFSVSASLVAIAAFLVGAPDSKPAGGSNARAGRRLLATAAMFAGAAVGAFLVLHMGVVALIHQYLAVAV